ncbi:MAG: hypothetical protein ACK4MZ_09210, partial [Thermomonas haemolytica]
MPTSPPSSSTSASCRFEWRPSRLGQAALLGLGGLGVFCVLACDLPAALAWPGALLVAAGAGVQLRRYRRLPACVVEIAPAQLSATGRRSPGRRGASSRRAASSRPRPEKAVIGSGRVTDYVSNRAWTLDATGFWQAHRGAPQVYTDVVGEWADAAAGDGAWDLYGGVGVFAAALAGQVGPSGR